MRNLSVCRIGILVLAMAVAVSALGQEQSWPVTGEIDLSSSFCDFRVGHFHGGIDIRTGGVEGREVYSPIDGFIWRIRYSYSGYGKSLYLKDTSGNIYVFGHLSRLADRFEKVVQNEQYKNRRYSIDQYYGHDSLDVKRGELLAFSGQTGAGPPHLHFEKRTASNLPLNPLTSGYPVEDNIPPIIEALGLNYVDAFSLFPGGERSVTIKVDYDRELKKYSADSTIFVSGPFGLEIKTFDRIRADGPKLNIYRVRLYIDDYITYETTYDRYNYAETRMVDLLFNYQLAVENKDYRHLLYSPPGKNFSGSQSPYKDGGIFSFVNENSYGLHNARVEVFDAAGNKSEAQFKFTYGPQGNLYETEWLDDTTFYLIAQPNVQFLDVESLQLFSIASGSTWRRLKNDHLEKRGRSDYRVTLPPESSRWKAVKVQAVGNSVWRKDDLFIPLHPKENNKYDFDYSLTDGGILFDIVSPGLVAPLPWVAVVYDDGYIESITPQQIGANRYAAFYRNHVITTPIIRLEVYSVSELTESREVRIMPAGYNERENILEPHDDLKIKLNKANFYEPVFIVVTKPAGWFQNMKDIVSPIYSIEPISIPLAEPFLISLRLTDSVLPEKVGVCRLNKNNGWSWMAPKNEDGWFSAKSSTLGAFALLKDTEPPKVNNIIPGDGKTVTNSLPQIKFSLSDNLSGVGSDQDLEILLDGKWVIPEYDPETSIVKTSPEKRLSVGKHTLEIKVSDIVGNLRTAKSFFYIK